MGGHQPILIMKTLVVFSTALLGSIRCLPFPQGGAPSNPLPIPRPGKDGSYGGDQFFQYINVPALNTFEWGFRRGNADHNIEEYLHRRTLLLNLSSSGMMLTEGMANITLIII